MQFNEENFEALIENTLRVELLNGRVIIYRINTENKKYLMNKLSSRAYGAEEQVPLQFIWFEIDLQRTVLINIGCIARVTFCFDYIDQTFSDAHAYYDNFKILHKDTFLEERKTQEGEVRIHVIEENTLPQAIIYHKGKLPDDQYVDNPITYSALDNGCLSGLDFELEGEESLRQFIHLTDDDGEENFIPLHQVMVMEMDTSLIYVEEVPEDMDEIIQSWEDFETTKNGPENVEEDDPEVDDDQD